MNSSKFLRVMVLIAALLLVGYAGLRTGMALRNRTAPPMAQAPAYPFSPGDSLPDVALADSAGASVQSSSLMAGAGTIVLFLDPTCDGCIEMSKRWEQAIIDGVVPADRVIGISREAPAVNEHFRAQHALRFPIYQDVASAYLQQHAVTTYPLEVVVGASGKIALVSDNSKAEIDANHIHELMAR